jgi:hypothetical protein
VRFFRQRSRDDPDKLAADQRDMAKLFVDTTKQLAGVEFDYSEASVAELDGWVDRLWDPEGPPPGEDELDSNSKLIGAYLGEVMIRHGGGHWVWTVHPRQPAIEKNGKVAWVLNKVYKRQVNGPEDSIAEFYATFRRIPN